MVSSNAKWDYGIWDVSLWDIIFGTYGVGGEDGYGGWLIRTRNCPL